MSFWKGLAKLALPVIGTAIAPGIGTAIGGALSGAIGGMGKQGSADQMNQQALQIAMQRYKETAPLRQQALAMAPGLVPQRPDLSSAFASGNPFSRTRPDIAGMLAGRTPTTAQPIQPPARPPMGGGGLAGGLNQDALRQALRQRQELV